MLLLLPKEIIPEAIRIEVAYTTRCLAPIRRIDICLVLQRSGREMIMERRI